MLRKLSAYQNQIYKYALFKRRIEAHICVAFVACKIYKELERQLRLKNCFLLIAEKAIDILKTIYQLTITTLYSKIKHTQLLVKNEDRSSLYAYLT
jgi:hypothetical protein